MKSSLSILCFLSSVLWVLSQPVGLRNPAWVAQLRPAAAEVLTNAPTPTFVPDGGQCPTNVSILSSNQMVYWTTNGDTPDTNLTAYGSGTVVTVTTTNYPLKAIAWTNVQNCIKSDIKSASYTNAIAAWTPNSLSGIQLWFRSEDLVGTAGTTISNWPNAATGKAAYYATNATASEMPMFTNAFGSLSSNALHFSAASYQNLKVQYLGIMNAKDSCSLVAAVLPRARANKRVIFNICKNNGSTYQSRDLLAITATDCLLLKGRTLDADADPNSGAGTGQGDSCTGSDAGKVVSNVVQVVQGDIYHSTSPGGQLWGYNTNLLYASTNNIATYFNCKTTNTTSATDSSNVMLSGGDDQSGNNAFFEGDMAEIIVTVPAMSGADRTNTWNFLKTKYGL